ncbi:MAG: hypothetical protein IPN18_18480 [Ignavibacteriales bacterium]|nr:hypothetical protein [Ignavibacteriales bacterium]
MTANFFYNGSNSSELDFDLANVSEDSIMIVYRSDAGQEWDLHPNIQKQKLVPKDGRGNIIITGLLPGQYAFANFATTTKVTEESTENILIYPNPVNNYCI